MIFEWEEIEGFKGWRHYAAFMEWLDFECKGMRTIEIEPITDSGLRPNPEKWYEQIPEGDVWIVWQPDAPCRGSYTKYTTKLQ